MNESRSSQAPVSVLAQIRAEVDAITEDQLIGPTDDVGDDEEKIGEANIEVRRLFTRSCQLIAMEKEKEAQISVARTKAGKEKFSGELIRIREMRDIVRRLFWAAVRDQFDCWGADGALCIRSNFMITLRREDPMSIPALLRRIGG